MENSKRRDDHFYNMIKKCQNGDRKTQNMIFNKLYPMMMPIAQKICGNKEDSEDALMESFSRMFSHIHEFYGENWAEMYQWVKKIVKNRCISNVISRERKTAKDTTDAESLIDSSTTMHPSVGMDLGVICDTIGTELPKRMSEALTSCTIDGLSCQETAKLMNTSELNVRVMVCRARDRLVELFPEYGSYR